MTGSEGEKDPPWQWPKLFWFVVLFVLALVAYVGFYIAAFPRYRAPEFNVTFRVCHWRWQCKAWAPIAGVEGWMRGVESRGEEEPEKLVLYSEEEAGAEFKPRGMRRLWP